MINGTYHVEMKTLLGEKIGKLTLNENGKTLSGVIDILGHCNELKGKILKNGMCILTGELVTPLRKMAFKAQGAITDKEVDMNLITDRDTLSLKGEIEKDERKMV